MKKVISLLSISGTTVICESEVKGDSNVTKIAAEQTLRKQGLFLTWSKYDGTEWTKTVYTNSLAMSNTKTALSS